MLSASVAYLAPATGLYELLDRIVFSVLPTLVGLSVASLGIFAGFAITLRDRIPVRNDGESTLFRGIVRELRQNTLFSLYALMALIAIDGAGEFLPWPRSLNAVVMVGCLLILLAISDSLRSLFTLLAALAATDGRQ